MVTLGGTEAEAQARARELEDAGQRRVPLAERALHRPVTTPTRSTPTCRCRPSCTTTAPAPSSGAERLYAAARAQPDLPLRELAQQLTQGASQIQFVGTPEQLADHIVAWQDAGAVDGFTIMGSTLPYELTTFVDHVVPILQARGRYRTEYAGDTLRDHLGLERPAGYTSTRPPAHA